VEPLEYIRSFFDDIKEQLLETKVGPDGKSARYRNLTVAAAWSNRLWEVRLDDVEQPVRRQFDPLNARSTKGAANCFVDALRRATGQEPVLRPEPPGRHYNASRTKT